jgi:Tfp pilus assembly protein PilF
MMKVPSNSNSLRFGTVYHWAISLIFPFVFAVTVLGQYSASTAEQVRIDLALAESAMAKNDPATAEDALRKALAVDPNNVTAEANLGAIAFVQGDCAKASLYLRAAISTAPTLVRARALAAICANRMGDPNAQSLLDASFSTLQERKLKIEVGMELAESLYRTGNLEHAGSVTTSLLQMDPNNVDALYMGYRVYSDLADGTLNKLALVAPNSARMEQVIAEHLVNAGDLNKAILHYRAALKINPKLPGVHYELGESLLQTSQNAETRAEAEKEFLASIAEDGDTAATEAALGSVELVSRPDEAITRFDRAFDLDPDNDEANLGLATLFMNQNKLQDALPHLQKILDRDPMRSDARYRMFRVLQSLGNDKEARKQLALFRSAKTIEGQTAVIFEQMNRPKQKDQTIDER